MRKYRPADWGQISDVENARGNPLYKLARLEWTKPSLWKKGEKRPTFETSEPFVYALVRNHGNNLTKDRIAYIGLTTTPKTRFGNHKTALRIVAKRGEVKFTYAVIDFVRGRNRIERISDAL